MHHNYFGAVISPMEDPTRAGVAEANVKKWTVFPGKNKFLCDGRVVTGRQPYVFYLTCALVIIISGLFFAFDCRYLWLRLTPAIAIIAVLIFIFVLASLIRTSWSDPGIIPRATPEEAYDIERQMEALTAASAGLTPDIYQPSRLRDISVNGVAMKLKYCPTCKIFRPPRASHCSSCDNCVDRFDHHCPWVGNCIGRRNYRYFYLFLVSVSLDCVYVCAFSVTTLVLDSFENGFITALKTYPTSIVEAVVAFFSLWSVIGLAGFHTFLAACNLTTNEDIKKSYTKAEQKNPFSRGSMLTNYCEVVCGPIPPSMIDARGSVTLDNNGRSPLVAVCDQPMVQAAGPTINGYSSATSQNGNLVERAETNVRVDTSKPYPVQPHSSSIITT